MASQVQTLLGTLDKMPAAVEAVNRSGCAIRPSTAKHSAVEAVSRSGSAIRPSTAKQSAAAGSSPPVPDKLALRQTGSQPSARNVPLGTGKPAAVVMGGDNFRRSGLGSSRAKVSDKDVSLARDDDQPGPETNSPRPAGNGDGGGDDDGDGDKEYNDDGDFKDEDDDEFYTPKSPPRSREPRRSQSADLCEKRAQMHGRPRATPASEKESSLSPVSTSGMKCRARDSDTASVASSMNRSVSSAQVRSWKDDEHIQEWYTRRKEKEREMAKLKIRRAHKDLNWVLERRTAQIANFRRDRKNEEKAIKATEVEEKAHSATSHLKSTVNVTTKLKLAKRISGKGGGAATHGKTVSHEKKGDEEGDAAAKNDGAKADEEGEDSLPSVEVPKPVPRPVAVLSGNGLGGGGLPRVKHREESVWLGPGRFVSMMVDKTERKSDSYEDVQYSKGYGNSNSQASAPP